MKYAELIALAEAQWIRSYARLLFFIFIFFWWKKAYMPIDANHISKSKDR